MQTKWLVLGTLGALFSLAPGCGGDDDSGSPSTGTGGTSASTGGSSAAGSGGSGSSAAGSSAACSALTKGSNITSSSQCASTPPPYDNQSCLNLNCPDLNVVSRLATIDEYGDCCKLVDLIKYNECKPADQKVYEYRVMLANFISQPTTLSDTSVASLMKSYYENRSFVLLYRVTGDLSKEGPVTFEGGPGVYNCDGTYSFFAKGTAPVSTWSSDTDRYASIITPMTWFPEGRLYSPKENWSTVINGNPIYNYSPKSPASSAEFPLYYEMPPQNFLPLAFPVTAEKPDCAGSRKSQKDWDFTKASTFHAFVRLDLADKISKLPLIPADETECQLLAFGIMTDAEVTKNTCKMDRCTPGSGCAWKELPDSLCGETTEAAKISPCHLGDRTKTAEAKKACDSGAYTDFYPKAYCELLKQWPEHCSMTAPTSLTDTPQCCDPLAKGTDGLPACNSWRVVAKAPLAAVEITDQPSSKAPTTCK